MEASNNPKSILVGVPHFPYSGLLPGCLKRLLYLTLLIGLQK